MQCWGCSQVPCVFTLPKHLHTTRGLITTVLLRALYIHCSASSVYHPYSHHKFMGSPRYLHSASIACQLPGCSVTAVRCCDGCPSMERAEACWLDMSWMSSQQQTETQNSWPAAMAPVGCCTLLQLHGCCTVIKPVKLQTVPQAKHVIK